MMWTRLAEIPESAWEEATSVIDRVDQVGYGFEHAAADCFVGELPEEPLDEVHPRATGRCEVQVKSRVLVEPLLDVLVLVGRVVVEDEGD